MSIIGQDAKDYFALNKNGAPYCKVKKCQLSEISFDNQL